MLWNLRLTLSDIVLFPDHYLRMFHNNISKIIMFYSKTYMRQNELLQLGAVYESEYEKLGLLKQMH